MALVAMASMLLVGHNSFTVDIKASSETRSETSVSTGITPAHVWAPSPPSNVTMDDAHVKAFGDERQNLATPEKSQSAPPPSHNKNAWSSEGQAQPAIRKAPKDKKVEVKTEGCTDMSVQQCEAGRTACLTDAGGTNGFKPPTITWVRVDGGDWEYRGVSCGPPTSVDLPGSSSGTVQVQAPPVPTMGEIQEAFRSLPFSMPQARIQPKNLKTAKNLKTFYAAQWPDDEGLQPGEISDTVTLLSWDIEFKVEAQDYRFDFGDEAASGWTTSTGGGYPDGDITHTYRDTGSYDVKVDARLTGQYRVNGGEWQDIDTVADLQDEPVSTLRVLGTKTELVTG